MGQEDIVKIRCSRSNASTSICVKVKFLSIFAQLRFHCAGYNQYTIAFPSQPLVGKMVNSAFVFLPLYLYPSNSSWDALTTSIAANPDLDFQIVIAPNLSDVYPDANYVAGIERLNIFSNVQTLGYVYTTWATRSLTEVKSDINCYAAWSNYSEGNIGVSGIFFDEAPSSVTNDTLSYMSTITTYAKTALGAGKDHITFNPGVAVDASFYDIADTINIFENSWAAFNLTALNAVQWDLLANSTYVIHNFTGGDSLQADLISNLTDSNVGGMLITTQSGYTAMSDLWAEFCEELADMDDGGDLPDGDVVGVDEDDDDWNEECDADSGD